MISSINVARFCFVLSVGALLAGAAVAAPADMRRACKADTDAQCAGVKPVGGALLTCLAVHRAQVSDACKIAIADQLLEHRAAKGKKDKTAAPAPAEAPAAPAAPKP
jgi:hypothetical protein